MLRSMLCAFLFVFLLGLRFAGVAHAAPPVVLVLGDSLSAGYGLKSGEAWPNLLATRLAQARPAYEVANISISGETTAGGRARLDAALKQHHPAVVIIALGANDGLRGLSLKAMRENLDAMVQSSQQAGARVLLVGMRMPPNYGPDYTRKFQQTYTDVAGERHVPLVPFLLEGFAEKRELFQADNTHPVAAAQATMLDTVWSGLKPMLK